MQRLNIIILVIIFFTSCQSDETKQVVTIENKYSISIPSFLTKVSNLNDVASLQYQHAWNEFYVIVIDESKEEMQKVLSENNLIGTYPNDINGYSSLLLNGLGENMKVTKKSKVINSIVNNMPARILTISAKVEGIDAFYTIAFIEGKNRYYQIMTWTLAKKESEYKEKMNQILHSLKEL